MAAQLWRPFIGAAAYAAVETGAGILLGDFFPAGRAEAGIFHLLRPWFLLIAVAAAAFLPWRERLLFYPLTLIVAMLAQGLFLTGLGAPNPWPELAWGWIAGLLAALLFDSLCLIGRDLIGRWGVTLGAAAGLFALAWGLGNYEQLTVDKGAPPAAVVAGDKPDLAVMTALPVIWGESERLLEGKRSIGYTMLGAEFSLRPLDVLDSRSLDTARLLLLAQPRMLAPAELAALDSWVRRGGRALILTDPRLIWPSRLPPGDARRAPAIGLLAPLLDHWGLSLHPPGQEGRSVRFVEERKLAVAAPGRFAARGGACSVEEGGLVARCAIGEGRAILAADADLLHDHMWIDPDIEGGSSRHLRLADNPLVVADWLDELRGARRARMAGEAVWTDPAADRAIAFLLAALPILAAAGAGLAARFRRKE